VHWQCRARWERTCRFGWSDLFCEGFAAYRFESAIRDTRSRRVTRWTNDLD
jgi:hypothetical protein